MTKSRKSKEQPGWTEQDMTDALEDLRGQTKPNLSATAERYGIPISTLRGRYTGEHRSYSTAHEHEQLMTSLDEFLLSEWLFFESDMGTPLSKVFILDLAQELTGIRPHISWVDRFLARNPDVVLGKPSGLDPKRARAFNRKTVGDHFKTVRADVIEKRIPLEHLWNMDEKGIQRGGGRGLGARKFFVPRERRPRYRMHSASLELTTIVEAVNAAGQSILPGFIFQGKELLPEWLEVNPEISIATSTNGWTDDSLCFEWFQKVFIPESAKLRVSDAPIVLIFDGHGSHVTMQMRELAVQNNIQLYLLPAHTTHHLQPLDKGCFGPLQKAWQEACARVLSETGQELQRCDVVRVYMQARDKAFTSNTIREAWRKTGLAPFNPDIFTDADFAPSISFSTSAHAPDSYPTNHPYFPENALTEVDFAAIDEIARRRELDPDVAVRERYGCSPMNDGSTQQVGAVARDREHTPTASGSGEGRTPAVSTRSRTRTQNAAPRAHSEHRYRPYPATRESMAAENERLRTQLDDVEGKLRAAEAHSKHMLIHATVWKKRALTNDEKKKKGGRKNVLVGGGFITSREAMEKGAADEAARLADESRKQAAKDKRTAEEEARRTQRVQNAGAFKFSGSLSSKNLFDLQDIAYELTLPTKNGNKDLTKAQLIDNIVATLNRLELDLRHNERFAGLYLSLDRTRKRATGDDPGSLNGTGSASDENAPPTPPSQPARTPTPFQSGYVPFSPSSSSRPLTENVSPRPNRIFRSSDTFASTSTTLPPLASPNFYSRYESSYPQQAPPPQPPFWPPYSFNPPTYPHHPLNSYAQYPNQYR